MDGRRGRRWKREKPAMYAFPPQALAWRRPGGGGRPAAQSGSGFVFILTHFHSRTALCLLLEVTSDWLLPMGLPEFSPRSTEPSAPLKSFQGRWATTLEFLFITSHEQCAQYTSCKQNKSGLSNRDLFFSPKKQFGVGSYRITSSAQ